MFASEEAILKVLVESPVPLTTIQVHRSANLSDSYSESHGTAGTGVRLQHLLELGYVTCGVNPAGTRLWSAASKIQP